MTLMLRRWADCFVLALPLVFGALFGGSSHAADLALCTHTSGAVVHTRSPEILGADFKCTVPGQKKGFIEIPPDTKLDPTTKAPQENADCPSTTRLKVNSSGYSGSFNVELRKGNRPGSLRINGGSVSNGGELSFPNVCRGTYFFAFGPTDSDMVSITRYFPVKHSDTGFSNPVITVYYSRVQGSEDTLIQKTRKQDL